MYGYMKLYNTNSTSNGILNLLPDGIRFLDFKYKIGKMYAYSNDTHYIHSTKRYQFHHMVHITEHYVKYLSCIFDCNIYI
jgi:hypothetical protein